MKARGLPFSTTEYELAGFFEEYDVRTLVTIVSHSMLKNGYDSEESRQLSIHFIGASPTLAGLHSALVSVHLVCYNNGERCNCH